MKADGRYVLSLNSQEAPFHPFFHRSIFWITCSVILLFLSACAPTHRAPVIERAPAGTRSAASTRHHAPKEADWRPDVYVVQKGDTLYSIALEHGLDYRDLSEWNDIADPNVIMIGRKLRLKPPQQQAQTAPLKPSAEVARADADGMLKTQPKPVKQPYSERGLAQIETPPAEKAAKAESKATVAEPKDAAQPDDDDQLDWGWPASGKILAKFSDSQNAKGMDIGGKAGQPVLAAAAGKVVYSGSGLRGYGKLIIIKHNKTFLSAYAHNSQILVKEGQVVPKGFKIAEMGGSDADQVELHFEIRQLGKPVDPMKYLPGTNE